MGHRHPRLFVAATLLVLALSGCGDDDPDPDADPTWTPTASMTPTDATDGPQRETAREFIQRWIEVGNKAQRTGDVAEYLELSAKGCDGCRQFADAIVSAYEGGGSIRTGGARVAGVRHDGGEQWHVTLRSGPTVIRESDDGPVERLPGGEERLVVFIAQIGDEWKLKQYYRDGS